MYAMWTEKTRRKWLLDLFIFFMFQVRDLYVNCLAFSNAPEGLSVNVIAGGLESGLVRLWSSWDLRPLRDICWEHS